MTDDVQPDGGEQREVSSSSLLLSVDPLQGTTEYRLSNDDADEGEDTDVGGDTSDDTEEGGPLADGDSDNGDTDGTDDDGDADGSDGDGSDSE